VDIGETPQEAALRELKEETGLVGIVVSVSPPLFMDVALSNEKVCVVRVIVDGKDPQNCNPLQHLEDTEHIDVTYISDVSSQKLENFALHENLALDINIYQALIR
jgi:8-oxo-dGTP pyrophosphatase MutT (NUDIX family)